MVEKELAGNFLEVWKAIKVDFQNLSDVMTKDYDGLGMTLLEGKRDSLVDIFGELNFEDLPRSS